MKKRILFSLFLGTILVFGCKDEVESTAEDQQLFDESSDITGFTYYKESDLIRESSPESPHNKYFRVRFNSTAQAVLTDDGKIPEGETFPDGSIVVKELYDTQDGALKLLAVMKKSNSEYAGAGWLWGEYKPDGNTFYSVSSKGSACVSCHSINHRDYTRIFDLFP